MQRIMRVFLAGLLALLPLIATIAATIWLVNFAIQYIGPDSMFGSLLTSIGLGLDQKGPAPYLGGLIFMLGIVYIFGLIVSTSLGPWFHTLVDSLLLRIPIIGSLYQMSRRFVAVMDPSDEGGIKNMTPVWCFFGGDGGAAVLALLPSATPVHLGSSDYVGILVPSAPVPVGGALVYVPEDWVKPAEVGIDQLVSIYVSMGMTPPTSIPPSTSAQPPLPGPPQS
jgi:uncharacterized membrane protein